MNKQSYPVSARIHFDKVSVHYHSTPPWLGGKPFKVLQQLDLSVETQNLAIVGPSGAGKSTLIELLFGLRKPTMGEVYVCGYSLSTSSVTQRRMLCQHIQLIPQEPQTSLNPYYTVRQILTEPLINATITNRHEAAIQQVLKDVGLDITLLDRYPLQLSVGQAQRVAIARALIVEPCVLVADEPTSSLDPVSRKQVLDLLASVQKARHMRLILVTHDLDAAKTLCDEILVLHQGKMVEYNSVENITLNPVHAVTQALIRAQKINNNLIIEESSYAP